MQQMPSIRVLSYNDLTIEESLHSLIDQKTAQATFKLLLLCTIRHKILTKNVKYLFSITRDKKTINFLCSGKSVFNIEKATGYNENLRYIIVIATRLNINGISHTMNYKDFH